MTETETAVVEREVRIRAQPETIFPFFTDPALMVRWQGSAVTLDPRPGGVYRVQINDEHIARGQFIEVAPPHRLVFSWGWEGQDTQVPPGSSTVEVTLTPDGEHTIVRLLHRDLPSEESSQSHAVGWEHYLERLEIVGAGGDAGTDPWAESAVVDSAMADSD
jgi:uncharacterized protein YndB with AHSA1/START domain